MLILTRKSGEKINIGDDIVISVLEIKATQIRLGIDAPRGVPVHRGEIYDRIQQENLLAAGFDLDDFNAAAHLYDPDKKWNNVEFVAVKVETSRFGEIEVPDDKVITMSRGMLGFPARKRYCILQHQQKSPFFWYQSVDDPSLAFVITNPWLFKPDYRVDIQSAGREMGWYKKGEDVGLEVYVVVTIPKGEPEKMTANLMGPLVLNPTNCEAIQIVLSEENYTHKFPLINKGV